MKAKDIFHSMLIVILVPFFSPAGEIHEAAEKNDLKKIKSLIEANPKLVHVRDERRRTVLHLSAIYGDEKSVSYLISKGAKVNDTWISSLTPLHLTNDPKIAKVLIDNGANIKSKSYRGTPFEYAIELKKTAMIKFLRDSGEKLDFDALVKLGQTKEVAVILKEKPWMAKAPRKPLHEACEKGHYEMAKLLLKHGADPNLDYGFSNVANVYSPFSSAVTRGHYEIASLLCQHGASMDVAAGKMYDNLFQYVLANRKIRFVELMIKHGVDVNSSDHWGGLTPLHNAANYGDLKKAALLIKHKADLNAKTPDGATPLMFAAIGGYDKMVEYLLAEGAQLDFHSACALGKRDFVERALRNNPKLANKRDRRLLRPPLFWAVKSEDLQLVKLLLSAGAKVDVKAPFYSQPGNVFTGPEVWDRKNWKKEKGDTLLHIAANGKNVEFVRLLLDLGAKTGVKNFYDETPHDIATRLGRTEVVQLLELRKAKSAKRRAVCVNPIETVSFRN